MQREDHAHLVCINAYVGFGRIVALNLAAASWIRLGRMVFCLDAGFDGEG